MLMDPETVQAVIAPAFLLMGLSHLVQPQLWVRFFELTKQTGMAAVIIPMYTLPFGLVLVVGHNVWTWDWPLFLTLAGWLMTIKCTLYLLVPSVADRMLVKQLAKSARSFRIVGAIATFFGGVIMWQSWT